MIVLNKNLVLYSDVNKNIIFPSQKEFEKYISGFASERAYISEKQAQAIMREFFLYKFEDVLEELEYIDRVSFWKLLWWRIKEVLR